MAAAWKSAGASALLDAILYDDAGFSYGSYGLGDQDPPLSPTGPAAHTRPVDLSPCPEEATD